MPSNFCALIFFKLTQFLILFSSSASFRIISLPNIQRFWMLNTVYTLLIIQEKAQLQLTKFQWKWQKGRRRTVQIFWINKQKKKSQPQMLMLNEKKTFEFLPTLLFFSEKARETLFPSRARNISCYFLLNIYIRDGNYASKADAWTPPTLPWKDATCYSPYLTFSSCLYQHDPIHK